jgi:glycosyltransferase involved in cell wall biosynthesis
MKQNKDVKVDVLCYNTDKAKSVEKYRGMTIYRVPCIQILPGQFSFPNYIELIKMVRKLFKKNKYDLINSHTRFFETSWWTPWVGKIYKTKSILTDHCSSHPVHESFLVNKISYIIDRYFVPSLIKPYDFITVTNKTTQKFLSTLGIKKTSVIYGGVNIKEFSKSKQTDTRTLSFSDKTFSKNDVLITFVGRMIHSKGPHLLLDAVEEIVKKRKNVHVLMAGNGPEYQKLSKKASNQIIFLGSLNKTQVAELLSKTDILVHPSLHHEGFPNVLLEAGASECAIIATDMGGTHEIINGKTGILIKPEVKLITKSLNTLLLSKSIRQKYGRAARAWIVENYSWDKIARQYKKFITTEVLGNK